MPEPLSEAEREEMRELAEEQVAMSLGRVITARALGRG